MTKTEIEAQARSNGFTGPAMDDPAAERLALRDVDFHKAAWGTDLVVVYSSTNSGGTYTATRYHWLEKMMMALLDDDAGRDAWVRQGDSGLLRLDGTRVD